MALHAIIKSNGHWCLLGPPEPLQLDLSLSSEALVEDFDASWTPPPGGGGASRSGVLADTSSFQLAPQAR